ncbi:MAG: hypothetical protein TR69_WS6001001446 [candidate division WS6 bacterium OLB20]|uniref:Uncharacterized protein n=1 Tax=candidate division WS6 bacterium OLB20 TaxID=1617426 RepID=A0A136LW06_9BACT|nr:MAG: hypothetical protein TR69_WS6001001446 [candidate division WS6 bacterium OLB20]
MPPKPEELLSRLRDLLEQEGISTPAGAAADDRIIAEYVLPALEHSQNVLADLYSSVSGGSGSLKSLKQKIIGKVASVSRNTVEKKSDATAAL